MSSPSEPEDGTSSNEKVRMFHEKLTILNENFLRFLRTAYKEDSAADFVRYFQKMN